MSPGQTPSDHGVPLTLIASSVLGSYDPRWGASDGARTGRLRLPMPPDKNAQAD